MAAVHQVQAVPGAKAAFGHVCSNFDNDKSGPCFDFFLNKLGEEVLDAPISRVREVVRDFETQHMDTEVYEPQKHAWVLGEPDPELPLRAAWKYACPVGPMEQEKWRNFQGEFGCGEPATVLCPTDVGALQEVVKEYKDVRASGKLHSWTQFTCPKPGAGADAAIVSTANLNEILQLDESSLRVKVQAGVSTRQLMNWLADRGYVLPSVPFWIDQTVAGAVSTSTHGAEFRPGMTTMSSMVRSMDLVLADGSLRHLEQGPDDDDLRAARTAVGKVGIIYQLEFAVQKDYCMEGKVLTWSEPEFINWLEDITPDDIQPEGSLAVQQFWYPGRGEVVGNSRKILDRCRSTEGVDATGAMMSVLYGIVSEIATCIPWAYQSILRLIIEDSTFCTGQCMASQRQIVASSQGADSQVGNLYSQYEWAVPLDKAHQCFSELLTSVLPPGPKRNLVAETPPSIRAIGPDDSYLSYAADGPQMLINMNIDVEFRGHYGEECTTRDQLEAHMTGPSCDGRSHWGKASWPAMDKIRAESMFPKFGDFEAARKKFDPEGKFVGDRIFDSSLPPQPRGACNGPPVCLGQERQASRCACTAHIGGLAGWFQSCTWALP